MAYSNALIYFILKYFIEFDSTLKTKKKKGKQTIIIFNIILNYNKITMEISEKKEYIK